MTETTDKPYRLYRGGRKKGKVPVAPAQRPSTATADAETEAPSALGAVDRADRGRRDPPRPGVGHVGVPLVLPRGRRGERATAARREGRAREAGLVVALRTDHDPRDRDGRRAGSRPDRRQSLGLAPAPTHRPRARPDRLPLHPARPPGRDPGLRLVEDQRREPDGRAGTHDQDREGAHRTCPSSTSSSSTSTAFAS